MGPTEPPLIQRFRSWLEPAPSAEDAARERFFTDGLVVLDTNILLSLYEYTESAREDVFTALEAVSERLWMPHQVGLEFVRGRRGTLESRKAALDTSAKEVNQHLTKAVASVIAARNVVVRQLAKYGAALDVGDELTKVISDASVKDLLLKNRELLKAHLEGLKSQHGLPQGLAGPNDPVLLRVAHMYGDRIGTQPNDSVLRARIEEAVDFRFPNEIPPGYRDFGKETPMKAAGDFLLWEEVIEHAQSLPTGSRILFVSNDTKEDWYESRKGSGDTQRPWPMLFDEVRKRTGTELRIETPSLFYAGIKQFLHTGLDANTYEEIERISSAQDIPVGEDEGTSLVTVHSATHLAPPRGLATEASRAIGLTTTGTQAALKSSAPSFRIFQWWIIGVTAQLGRREASASEVKIDIAAAVRGDKPTHGQWEPATRLRPGDWVHRESCWIASWFIRLLHELPRSDHDVLRSLAAQQAEANRSDSD